MKIINPSDMDIRGVFPCPNCNKSIDPDDEVNVEVISGDARAREWLIVRHVCGERIKINLKEEVK